MDRRGFVRLAGVIIGMAGIGSKNVLGDPDIDPAATPPNSEYSPIRGNSLSSVAESVPLEHDDIEEVTVTREDSQEVTYWIVRHGIEYDRAIYREPARLGGRNFELGGSDTGSFWFGIAGPDLERIPHQGQVTLYLRVAGDEEPEEDSTSSASPGRGRGNRNDRDGEDVDTEEDGDEKDAEWMYLKAQFTAGWKDELLHVNGVKLDGDGGEDDEEDENGDEDEDEGEGEEDNGDDETDNGEEDGQDDENGDEDEEGEDEDVGENGDDETDNGEEDGQDDENGDEDEEGEDEEDGDGDVDDEDGDQESLGSSEVSGGPEGGNRPPDAKDRLHAVLDRILREL